MSSYLLDVNVLIALIDPGHSHFQLAHHWFATEGQSSWMTCPITELGLVRVVSGKTYPNPATPAEAIKSLESLLTKGSHSFVTDSCSLLDNSLFTHESVINNPQLTDTYLLGLAVSLGVVFATLDRRIVAGAVRSGEDHLLILS
jgi:toxin-antitoxin system PIN domain toxin